MTQKGQHILVIIQDNELIGKLAIHAFKLAHIFQANVAFLDFTSFINGVASEFPVSKIDEHNINNINYKEVTFGATNAEPNNFIQQLDAIFIITAFSQGVLGGNFKRLPVFKYLSRAKIPSILIGSQTINNCDYKNIIVPVDEKKEIKEKMIWASYFGRFNKAMIHLVVANEKSQVAVRRIKATLIFTKRMYKQFDFDYKIVKAISGSRNLRKEAYKFSEQYSSDLMVLLSSKNYSWFSNNYGPTSIKRLLRKERNPILLINPVKDYYLPCS